LRRANGFCFGGRPPLLLCEAICEVKRLTRICHKAPEGSGGIPLRNCVWAYSSSVISSLSSIRPDYFNWSCVVYSFYFFKERILRRNAIHRFHVHSRSSRSPTFHKRDYHRHIETIFFQHDSTVAVMLVCDSASYGIDKRDVDPLYQS
jgi:hypothetical protein